MIQRSRPQVNPQILLSGILFGEQPRWHEDRLWFSDWGAREVIAVDLEAIAKSCCGHPHSHAASIGYPTGGYLSSRHTTAFS
jgi:sugar lactone lactonase YvrE